MYPLQELEAWLESWPRGVVYVSFGTNADPARLGARPLRALRRVLGALPHGVLWPRAPPPLPANVRAAGWLPQADLLRESPPQGRTDTPGAKYRPVSHRGRKKRDDNYRLSIIPIFIRSRMREPYVYVFLLGRYRVNPHEEFLVKIVWQSSLAFHTAKSETGKRERTRYHIRSPSHIKRHPGE